MLIGTAFQYLTIEVKKFPFIVAFPVWTSAYIVEIEIGGSDDMKAKFGQLVHFFLPTIPPDMN